MVYELFSYDLWEDSCYQFFPKKYSCSAGLTTSGRAGGSGKQASHVYLYLHSTSKFVHSNWKQDKHITITYQRHKADNHIISVAKKYVKI